MPLNPAASSLADRPSTTKLLERLRWLPTEMLMPGTADVSGNSCVLAMFVGETPGTSNASSRKLRPFIGSALTSASGTVAAIWLRAPSRTGVSAETLTVVSSPAGDSVEGKFIGGADPKRQPPRRIAEA